MEPIYILSHNIGVIGVFDSLDKVKCALLENKSDKSGWLTWERNIGYMHGMPDEIDHENFVKIVETKFGKPRWFPVYISLVDIERDPYGEDLRTDYTHIRDTYKIEKLFMNNDSTELYALDSEKYKAAEKNIEM